MSSTRPTHWYEPLLSPAPWGVLLASYWCFMFYLTHMPGHAGPPRVTMFDKLGHGVGYGLLAFLLAWVCWLVTRRPWSPSGLVLWLVLAAYGAFDEISQLAVGRSCDLYDWLADVTGLTVGLATFYGLSFVIRRQAALSSTQ